MSYPTPNRWSCPSRLRLALHLHRAFSFPWVVAYRRARRIRTVWRTGRHPLICKDSLGTGNRLPLESRRAVVVAETHYGRVEDHPTLPFAHDLFSVYAGEGMKTRLFFCGKCMFLATPQFAGVAYSVDKPPPSVFNAFLEESSDEP